MRDIPNSVRGKGLIVAAWILVYYGLVNFIGGLAIVLLTGFMGFLFLITWFYLIFGGLYLALGFHIRERHEWAYYGTLVFVPIALALMIWTLVVSIVLADMFSTYVSIIHVNVHIIVLILVGVNFKEFSWKPIPGSLRKQVVTDNRTVDSRCENCKSENLTIFPDGSGRCNDCLRVFQNIRESTTGISD